MDANKVKVCEDFIREQFIRLECLSIETNLMFKIAALAGLYKPYTYGSEFSVALSNTVDVVSRLDELNEYKYSVFILKKGERNGN